jgi:hypothetical protein
MDVLRQPSDIVAVGAPRVGVELARAASARADLLGHGIEADARQKISNRERQTD